MEKFSETPWKTLSTKLIYQNKWISLHEDLVELPNGRTTIYGVVTSGPCVGVLPFLDPDTVLLIQQYRYVARRATWEMPTGGVHAGEAIEAAAQRELAEEVGHPYGIHGIFEDQGHVMTRMHEEVSARMPRPEERRDLRLPPGVPVLDVLHTSLDQQGQPYELTRFVMRTDLTGLLYDVPVE